MDDPCFVIFLIESWNHIGANDFADLCIGQDDFNAIACFNFKYDKSDGDTVSELQKMHRFEGFQGS